MLIISHINTLCQYILLTILNQEHNIQTNQNRTFMEYEYSVVFNEKIPHRIEKGLSKEIIGEFTNLEEGAYLINNLLDEYIQKEDHEDPSVYSHLEEILRIITLRLISDTSWVKGCDHENIIQVLANREILFQFITEISLSLTCRNLWFGNPNREPLAVDSNLQDKVLFVLSEDTFVAVTSYQQAKNILDDFQSQGNISLETYASILAYVEQAGLPQQTEEDLMEMN